MAVLSLLDGDKECMPGAVLNDHCEIVVELGVALCLLLFLVGIW